MDTCWTRTQCKTRRNRPIPPRPAHFREAVSGDGYSSSFSSLAIANSLSFVLTNKVSFAAITVL